MKEDATWIILLLMMEIKKLLKALYITTLLIIIAGWQLTPVEAQDPTLLSVEPSTIEVPLGNRVQLELEVSDGLNVNAFDLMINYDQERLSLLTWEHGEYLSNLSCTHLISQPGVFELACNQLARPEVDGDGVLLILIFDTLGIGFPDVTITEATFIDSTGGMSYPQREHGIVEVTNAPTYTSTPTVTYTPTTTRTSTSSPSPTPSLFPTATSTITPYLSPTEGAPTLTETEPGYPGEATAVPAETETIYPGGLTETAVSSQIPMTTPQPGESQTLTPIIPGTQEETISGETGDLEPFQGQNIVKNLWRVTLWGVVIFAGLVILGTIIFYIRRRTQKGDEEDLLL